jgi:hypothetical protein
MRLQGLPIVAFSAEVGSSLLALVFHAIFVEHPEYRIAHALAFVYKTATLTWAKLASVRERSAAPTAVAQAPVIVMPSDCGQSPTSMIEGSMISTKIIDLLRSMM